jgi:hypothetical protein
LKTVEKRNGKVIRKFRKKEKGKAAQLAQLGPASRTPTRPCRLTGGFHLSAATPSPARPISPSLCPVGPGCRRRFPRSRALLLSLLCRPAMPVVKPLPQRARPLSLYAVGLRCKLRLPRARRGLARAHSRTSPGTSATSSAHASQLFLSTARTRTHFPASFHAAPLSLALCPRRPTSLETHARHPDHPAHRRPRQATPSSAPR